MVIKADGRVGIGTTAPAGALSIEGTNNQSSQIILKNTAPDPDSYWAITPLYDQDTLAIRSGNNSFANRLTITASGNVDIGGASHAARKFSVKSTATDDSINAVDIYDSSDASLFRILSNGIITSPKQPAFQISIDSTKTSGTDFNSTNTIPFNNEIIDTNADYNTTSKTFTAPVTGSYQINVFIYLLTIPAEDGYIETQIITSNRAYYIIYDPNGQDATSTYHTFCNSVVADMDANDTATCAIVYTISAGWKLSSACVFSGFLIG